MASINGILAIKQNGGLVGLTDADHQHIKDLRSDSPVRIDIKSTQPRNIKFHQLYWAGLLGLAMQYWQPKSGLITPAEKSTLQGFVKYLSGFTDESAADSLAAAAQDYLNKLNQSRRDKTETPENSIEALHEWVKMEAGYYKLYQTPSGIRKVPGSISFASMDEPEFKEFYRRAFNVVWKFILNQHFEDESQAENAISQLLDLE